jgi:hypothetical protein
MWGQVSDKCESARQLLLAFRAWAKGNGVGLGSGCHV